MKKIKLNNKSGVVESALVDDEDYEELSKYAWHLNSKGYVVGYINGKHKKMHRIVMSEPVGLEVDHIFGNKLDNRKSQLRICTHAQNGKNTKVSKLNTSGYKGVSWFKAGRKWRAYIKLGSKQIHLGFYTDINDAVAAYKEAAMKYYGEYARC